VEKGSDTKESLNAAAVKRVTHLGRRVSVREEDMHVEGVAMDLDEEGCLLVTLDDGSSVRVREGEVIPIEKGARG